VNTHPMLLIYIVGQCWFVRTSHFCLCT